MLPICPCRKCTPETGRKVGCHGVCKDYIEWKKENDAYNEIRKQEVRSSPNIRRYNY
jgi:hypothetical protein